MPTQTTKVIDSAGGSVVVDRLIVQFPPGAFAQATTVTCTILERFPSAPSYLAFAYAFQIEAAPVSPPANLPPRHRNAEPPETAAPLHKAATLAVNLNGLFPATTDVSLISLLALTVSNRRWQHPDFKRDEQKQVISTEITRAGTFAVVLNNARSTVLPASKVVGRNGGRIEYGRRLNVEFPAGAVDEDVIVEVGSPRHPMAPWRGGLPFPFSVVAKSATKGTAVSKFKAPIRLTFAYEDAELGSDFPVSLRFNYFDQDTRRWAPIKTNVDAARRTISAEVDHLTDFNVGAPGNTVSQDLLPSMRFASVDLFTGASTIRSPFELPPGRGGLTPKLFLVYNGQASRHSQRANYLSGNITQGHGMQSASQVGQGFDIELGHVDWQKLDNGDERYYLTLNGQSYRLIYGTDGYWHTEDETYLRISRDVVQPDGRTAAWQVIAKDGTKYLFGVDAAERDRRIYVWWDGQGNPHQSPNRWMLGQIRDTNANTIDYTYERLRRMVWRACEGGFCNPEHYTPAVFPQTITYSGGKVVVQFIRTNYQPFPPGQENNVRANNGSDQGRDRRDVDVANWITDPYHQHFFDVKALDSIDVYVNSGATFVRRYKFEYKDNEVDGQGQIIHVGGIPLRLDKVTLWGDVNGTNKLPSLAFTDSLLADFDQDVNGNTYNNSYWLLTSVDNGQGGVSSFANQFSDVLYGGAWEYRDKWGSQGLEFRVRIARIERRTENPGFGPSMVTRFEYTSPRGNDNAIEPEFRGHAMVKAYQLNADDSDYAYTEHHFCQGCSGQGSPPVSVIRDVYLGGYRKRTFEDVKQLRGREFLTKIRTAGAGSIVLGVSDRKWSVSALIAGVSYFVFNDEVWEYAYRENETDENAATKKEKRATYTFDGYGNLIDTFEYAEGAANWYRHSKRAFASSPNTTDWIVGKPIWVDVYEWDGTTDGRRKSSTSYYYDGNPYLPPASPILTGNNWPVQKPGNLRAVRRCWNDAGVYRYSDTFRNYDSYGNMVEEKTGRDWGTNTAWAAILAVTQWKDETLALGYDTTYRTYPVHVDNPLSQRTTYVHDARWGAPTSVTDVPNNVTTSGEFDTFGRPIKLIRPGDSPASPTIEHNYRNYQASPLQPFRIETLRKKNGTDPAYKTRIFHDGLGREVQRYSDGVGYQVAVNTHYNSRGLKDWESVPYFLTPASLGDFDQGAWNDTTKPRSQYAYDAVRRPTTITNPDNTQRSASYSGWDITLIDENSHKKVRKMDAFERMVIVEEYTGNGPSNYAVYATTSYGYNVLDNLASVRDQAGNITTMVYDELSRKIQMTDPDMGTWYYGYDAAGNLISQTDNRGITISFVYDLLNRPIRKHYPKEWVDAPLTTNHSPGVYDLMEIRASIDVDRIAAGVTPNPYNWNNPAIVAGKDVTIRAVHFNEMRDPAMQGLWNAATMGTVPAFTRGTIQVNPPRAISLQDPTDLRGWLAQFENSSWASQNGNRARAVYRYDNYSDTYNPGYSVGRRTEMWDASGRTRWTYDNRGRIIKEDRWIDGQLYVTEWGYDAMDRVLTMKYPDGEVVTYTYNNQLLLSSMSGSVVGAIISDLDYNALDLPTQVKLPNAVSDLYLRNRYYGSNLDYGVYPYGALWDIRLEKTGSNLLRLEHGYDYARNITRTIETPGWVDFTFEYDELDRLLKRKITGGADQETFGYSVIGNIINKNGAPYTYGSSKPHAVTGDGSQSYGYDPNGNMTQRGASQFLKYDAENRLVKASSDSGGSVYVARMAHDGDVRRVKRVDSFGTIHYVGPHYERNVGTGVVTTETITKFYSAQMGKIRRLIAFKKGSTLYYVIPDHLGSTLRVVDTSGNTIDDIRYHAFGATRSGGTNTPTDKRFTGQTLDLSIGLYHYGARSYDHYLGRFTQPDSIVPQPGNPQSLNRYAYGLNNPLKYTDPSGNAPWNPEDEGDGAGDGAPPAPVPAPTPLPNWEPTYEHGTFGEGVDLPQPVRAPTPTWFPTEVDEEAMRSYLDADYWGPWHTEVHQGVTVVSNVRGPAGSLIRALAGGAENTVTLSAGLIISSHQVPGDSDVMKHEMGHTEQAAKLGPLYIPVYVVLWGLTAVVNRTLDPNAIHKNHPMEVQANIRAGLPGEWGSY